MKIYQGEPLTFTMEIISRDGEEETIDNYTPRAVLVAEQGYTRDCRCYSRQEVRDSVLMRWDDIEVIDGIAVFEMTSAQSSSLTAGIYMIEVALRNKSDETDIKGQVKNIIEILPSFTTKR